MTAFPKSLKEMEAQGYEFTGSGKCRSCGADIENVVKSYGDCGKVALSLCAADFAAED